MLLCSFSADDCSSCVERSFKTHELVKKACHEYDFGKKHLMDEIKQPCAVSVILGDPGTTSWDEAIFLGESLLQELILGCGES